MFQGIFQWVSRVFERNKGVSRKSQRCFKDVLRMLTESFSEVSNVFQVSFKGVPRKFLGCLKEF